ncbi:sensor histidine kinase [Qaidamihabitans albus]|uniref:sensor histidine kinase n=1 Tax=Qaidamihabitans albus TaxID=2795733 RepID=UPI003FD7C4DA
MRAHPMVGDSIVAGLLLLIDILFFAINNATEEVPPKPWFVALPVDAALVLPLVFRRRYPLTVAYAVLVVGGVHAGLELGVSSLIASGISVYSVIVYVGRRQGALYFGLMLAASVVQLGVQNREDWLVSSVVTVLLMALCWLLGEFVGARRAYHAEVEARLHLLETERDQAARIAVGEERGRIARELHDVVAHAVSVIVVQADGASYAIRSNPEIAERAVRTISETGRGALAELRRLLEVLRDEENRIEPRVPQPNAAALAELADRMRTAGLPVQLDLGDDLADIPAGVSLGVYRIVQESLTNTLKHAGQGARAHVRVWRSGATDTAETGDTVHVEVSDDGAGRARSLVPTDGSGPVPGGNGLIGMRERANVFGGTLTAGPDFGGGWRVRASLPVRLTT